MQTVTYSGLVRYICSRNEIRRLARPGAGIRCNVHARDLLNTVKAATERVDLLVRSAPPFVSFPAQSAVPSHSPYHFNSNSEPSCEEQRSERGQEQAISQLAAGCSRRSPLPALTKAMKVLKG